MSTMARSTIQVCRIPRPCLASSSLFPFPFRGYATEAPLAASTSPPPPPADGLMFGGPPSLKIKNEVIMKRYTGKGFPHIPGLRHLVHPHHPHLHSGAPLRELTLALRRTGGRNDSGRVVNRFVGGGHRRRLRIVDFHRLESGEHDVIRVEYDPGRSAHIALLKRRGTGSAENVDEGAELAEMEFEGEGAGGRADRTAVKAGWSYILCPEGLRAGDQVVSYRQGIPTNLVPGWDDLSSGDSSRALGLLRTLTLKPGNVLPLNLLPPGTLCHNLSLKPKGRMQLCRSAGTFAQIIAHHGPNGEALGGGQVLNMVGGEDGKGKKGSVLVKLQSGEVRRLEPDCVGTVGTVSNKEHHSRQLGKAGRSRWLGQKPRVRGVAMNACDHPHGGGRGKSKGNKDPRSVWGWLTKGKRTRRSKDKDGNKMVVSERPRGKDKN
ncbi:large subunit ribosomal protein L2, partial [Tremellales sp. Uapishka_1]